jgi:hypothetical protein
VIYYTTVLLPGKVAAKAAGRSQGDYKPAFYEQSFLKREGPLAFARYENSTKRKKEIGGD